MFQAVKLTALPLHSDKSAFRKNFLLTHSQNEKIFENHYKFYVYIKRPL